MKTNIQESLRELADTNAKFTRAEISPLEHSRQREALLGTALSAIASDQNLILQEPLQIDARGEFSIVALKRLGSNPRVEGCAQFSVTLAELLTRFNSRTGVSPGVISPVNGWCLLNHFEAERLVKAYAEEQGVLA